MAVNTFLAAIVTGAVIGILGRLLSPTKGRIGCLLTVLIGIAAAVMGSALGIYFDVGFWITVVLQVVVAAVLVSLVRF